jgi:LemA protein
VQLKRRYDLIPNLIETVKGYAKHESGTFEKVIKMRSEAQKMSIDLENVTGEQMTTFMGMQDEIGGALGKIFALSENYPDLKANENFIELQREITDTEDKIQAARRFFNSMVEDFKVLLEMFPSNIIAKIFKFSDKEFFEIPENSEQRENIKVSF